ncbi:MAG: hypothetical protein Q8L55_15125 [Phycisphaerales bacterium]|nr:hypothetical protein [Phycisphaerales bacterium]
MILATLGIALATMVGPLADEPVVRISRPGGGPPEVVRQVAGTPTRNGWVSVPASAVAGGGGVTVVGGANGAPSWSESEDTGQPTVVRTEQLLRAFGYDRSNFGFTVLHAPRSGHGRWGGHHEHAEPEIDPRVAATLRDAAPLESRFPPVPGR